MPDSPNPVCQWLVAALFAILPVYFLIRAFRSGPRSRRFANIALFCGLMTLVMPEITAGFGFGNRSAVFVGSGSLRVILGLLGVTLAVAAFLSRRDGGTGVARPVIGLLFSLLHVAFAVGLICFGTYTPPPSVTPDSPNTGWEYHPPHGDYRLTLPSADWKQVPPVGGVGEASFVKSFPRVFCTVWHPLPNKAATDLETSVEEFRAMTKQNPQLVAAPKEREGINPAGHRYFYCSTLEVGPQGQPVFTAFSITWFADKKALVKVAFEGVSVMNSRPGREAELLAMEQTAEAILLSVK
jgi:hypothetical protein